MESSIINSLVSLRIVFLREENLKLKPSFSIDFINSREESAFLNLINRKLYFLK